MIQFGQEYRLYYSVKHRRVILAKRRGLNKDELKLAGGMFYAVHSLHTPSRWSLYMDDRHVFDAVLCYENGRLSTSLILKEDPQKWIDACTAEGMPLNAAALGAMAIGIGERYTLAATLLEIQMDGLPARRTAKVVSATATDNGPVDKSGLRQIKLTLADNKVIHVATKANGPDCFMNRHFATKTTPFTLV